MIRTVTDEMVERGAQAMEPFMPHPMDTLRRADAAREVLTAALREAVGPMSNIVHKLRAHPCVGLGDPTSCTLCDAADEIERLWAEVEMLRTREEK